MTSRMQCDQMTRLCFQYLAINSNEYLPQSICDLKLCPKPNKPKIYCLIFLQICQSGGIGGISPNLVALLACWKSIKNVESGILGKSIYQRVSLPEEKLNDAT